jgi:hypothetical protein
LCHSSTRSATVCIPMLCALFIPGPRFDSWLEFIGKWKRLYPFLTSGVFLLFLAVKRWLFGLQKKLPYLVQCLRQRNMKRIFFFLWRYSPNLGLGLPPWNSPYHFGLLDLRTPWAGDQLVAGPLPVRTHTLNIHSLSGIRTQDPDFRASKDSACLRPLGYRDHPETECTCIFNIRCKILGSHDGVKMVFWDVTPCRSSATPAFSIFTINP